MENHLAQESHLASVSRVRSPRRFRIALAVMLAGLLAGEVVLQGRAYLKTGRSAAALASGETVVAMNEAYGVRTYRPNFSLKRTDPGYRFVTNSHGLRSPEIPAKRAPGEYRIIVSGASTVAGVYAHTNELTFPGQLQALFSETASGPVNVVNAGVEGYAVKDMERLIDRALIKQDPSMMVIYSGFVDLSTICGRMRAAKTKPQSAPVVNLPHWVMTRQLISKNTLALREPPIRLGIIDPADHFPQSYPETLDRIVTKLKKAGVVPVLVTSARSYRGLPDAQAAKLAESPLFFYSCLDLAGLNKASELFNQAVSDVARKHKVQLIDLANVMPPGREYFVDANHFTRKGDRKAAEIIHAVLAGVIKH